MSRLHKIQHKRDIGIEQSYYLAHYILWVRKSSELNFDRVIAVRSYWGTNYQLRIPGPTPTAFLPNSKLLLSKYPWSSAKILHRKSDRGVINSPIMHNSQSTWAMSTNFRRRSRLSWLWTRYLPMHLGLPFGTWICLPNLHVNTAMI